jgi:hypothetical protein
MPLYHNDRLHAMPFFGERRSGYFFLLSLIQAK